MLAPTLREKDREAERDESLAHHSDLFGEALDALLNDPTRKISTPGWPRREAPAFDVLMDEMAGENSDEMRTRLARIVAWAATQAGDAKQQETALRFLMDVADAHADARAGL
jgi:hypothetical protein